jgi:hypothetical protein
MSRPPALDPTIEWLLRGDAAIVFQTLRDLLGATRAQLTRARRAIAREGWGARLLAAQDADGRWAAGLYNPKWTSTTYTLLLLRDLGLAPDVVEAQRGCALLLERGLAEDGGIDLGFGHSETCVTGMVLSILSHFELKDRRLDAIAEYLLAGQMPDGGWNCRLWRGATHASVHTTINALEGLHLYRAQRALSIRRAARVKAAEQRGREFLLEHRLFRSHRTGAIIRPAFLKLAFPPRWHYDILRALDHFQVADAPRDERLSEAIEILRQKRRAEGRWLLEDDYRGRTHFALERRGQPSRWNTLRALRVLRWWGSP